MLQKIRVNHIGNQLLIDEKSIEGIGCAWAWLKTYLNGDSILKQKKKGQ